MKSTKPRTTKQNLHVMRAEFEVLIVLKDDCFTKRGKLRANKVMQKGIADSLRFEGHKFLDSLDTQEIIDHAAIDIEEVEVAE